MRMTCLGAPEPSLGFCLVTVKGAQRACETQRFAVVPLCHLLAVFHVAQPELGHRRRHGDMRKQSNWIIAIASTVNFDLDGRLPSMLVCPLTSSHVKLLMVAKP